MNENRCERSGDRVWAYGTPSGHGTEVITCPGCKARVHMSTATSRLAEHDRPAEWITGINLRALGRSRHEPYTGAAS